jgi:restriction system protein
MEETTKGGQSKFENKVGWARFYLAKGGFIDTEQRGVWVLTETGRKAKFSHDDAYNLFRTIHDGFQRLDGAPGEASFDKTVDDADASAPDAKVYLNQDAVQQELVHILRNVTDKGFEELCARLLRHIGFENLKVTGQTGDHGIDGEGFLLINRFVRIKVMFQCKRYANTVQAKEVRDFRGAIQGRTERGIFSLPALSRRGPARKLRARTQPSLNSLTSTDC